MSQNATNRLIRIRSAADQLGRTVRQLRQLILDGAIHGIRQRGRWYLHEEAIEEFLKRSKETPPGKEMIDD